MTRERSGKPGHTLLGSGVEVCFANPGTSEMHFVAALDRIPGMRCVLGLHENVVTGCADGYWRMAGPARGHAAALRPRPRERPRQPAQRPPRPVRHRQHRRRPGDLPPPLDPPLTADTEGWARGVSAWVRTSTSAATVGADAAVAVQAARTVAGADRHPGPAGRHGLERGRRRRAGPAGPRPAPPPDPHAVRAPPACCGRGGVLLLLGGRALRAAGAARWPTASPAATGCRLLAEASNARVARGRGRAAVERVPYVVDQAVEALRGVRHLILVRRAGPGRLLRLSRQAELAPPGRRRRCTCSRALEQDAEAALQALARRTGRAAGAAARPGSAARASGAARRRRRGWRARVAALMPEGADRGRRDRCSYGRGFFGRRTPRRRTTGCRSCGGAIGCGIAARDRRRRGGARAPGDQPAGGRLGHVHGAGAVDPGARATAGDHGRAEPAPLAWTGA